MKALCPRNGSGGLHSPQHDFGYPCTYCGETDSSLAVNRLALHPLDPLSQESSEKTVHAVEDWSNIGS